jgi:isoamylase
MFLNGAGIHGTDSRGQPIVDDSFLVCFNAHDDSVEFCLPAAEYGTRWEVLVDTAGVAEERPPALEPGAAFKLAARSIVLLRSPRPTDAAPSELATAFVADSSYAPASAT